MMSKGKYNTLWGFIRNLYDSMSCVCYSGTDTGRDSTGEYIIPILVANDILVMPLPLPNPPPKKRGGDFRIASSGAAYIFLVSRTCTCRPNSVYLCAYLCATLW